MLSKHSTTKPPLILFEFPEMRNAKPLRWEENYTACVEGWSFKYTILNLLFR